MSVATLNAAFVPGILPARPPVRALDRGGLVSIAAAVVLLLVIAAASVWQSANNAQALAVAQQTRAQRNLVNDMLMEAMAAETSQRGYLITLNPEFLQPLEQAEAALPESIAKARALWPDDRRLVLLSQAATAKIAELRRTAALAQDGQLPQALAIVKTNAGLQNMVVIRHVTDQLAAEQDMRLLQQVSRVSRGSRLLVAIDLAGLVMVFGLAGLIALGLRGYLDVLRNAQSQTRKAYDELEYNNGQLDAAVRNRTAALTAANDEIQRFAYIVSHDLRAPLVNIMGFTSELEQAAAVLSRHAMAGEATAELREAAQADIPEALRFIKTSTTKMDRLINAILKLSREGRRVLAPESLDMTALLNGLVATMRHQAETKGASVSVGAVPGLVADRLAVEQVFGNIVENALKYLKPGRPGDIRIQGRLEGAMARFEISDNGRGIAARDYERVFELFRRAGDQSVPGEGIGLAHVRALVRRLGGSVDCISEIEVGSTFVVRLPTISAADGAAQDKDL